MNFAAGVDTALCSEFTAWITAGRATFIFSFTSVDGYMVKWYARTGRQKFDAETVIGGPGYSCVPRSMRQTPPTPQRQTDRQNSSDLGPALSWPSDD